MDSNANILNLIQQVKSNAPLVHHITNNVTINDCANITLAIGASPVMTSNPLEVEEIVACASALVLNMGTLMEHTVKSMLKAGKLANKLGIPVILDPVGIGATHYRLKTVLQLQEEVQLSVIKGNMSEIKTLAGIEVTSKGVDSTADNTNAKVIAKDLAIKTNTTIVITGKTDIVTNGKNLCLIQNGHPFLSNVSGTGCMTASLIGAFSGVTNAYSAAILGTMIMGIAGERAYKNLSGAEGIGTYKVKLFDEIFFMNEDILQKEGVLSFE